MLLFAICTRFHNGMTLNHRCLAIFTLLIYLFSIFYEVFSPFTLSLSLSCHCHIFALICGYFSLQEAEPDLNVDDSAAKELSYSCSHMGMVVLYMWASFVISKGTITSFERYGKTQLLYLMGFHVILSSRRVYDEPIGNNTFFKIKYRGLMISCLIH